MGTLPKLQGRMWESPHGCKPHAGVRRALRPQLGHTPAKHSADALGALLKGRPTIRRRRWMVLGAKVSARRWEDTLRCEACSKNQKKALFFYNNSAPQLVKISPKFAKAPRARPKEQQDYTNPCCKFHEPQKQQGRGMSFQRTGARKQEKKRHECHRLAQLRLVDAWM